MAAGDQAFRFGFGLPTGDPAAFVPATALTGGDRAAAAWPGVDLAEVLPVLRDFRRARRAKDAVARHAALAAADSLALRATRAHFARALGADDPLRERLVAFWADHFTTVSRSRVERVLPLTLIDAAIRPHVAGRFGDMLRAVVTHPAMLVYLDQAASVGPGSRKGRDGARGLNENLARELLELHTLGTGAPFAQTDVRELAELLTGLTADLRRGFVFDDGRAEPGPETVLGRTFAGTGLAPVLQALDHLAARPETARHLAGKLAVHFVADQPDPGLVDRLARTYLQTGGDLAAVVRALLGDPAAQGAVPGKLRQPFDFLISALRALGIGPGLAMAAAPRELRRLILDPLAAMGQPFLQAPGPDGWPEAAADWITPQGLAARIDWAMAAPVRLVRPLPDPRDFLRQALGDRADPRLARAVAAAESARDGVGLVLASPAFNRR
jgi:uncharacterized protein (DUF1800 family)